MQQRAADESSGCAWALDASLERGEEQMRVLLASRSPQRSAILTQLGIPFRVQPSEHDEQTVARCLVLAATNGLVPTGGSDFHGETKPDVRLGQANGGRPVPDAVLAGLKARWAERQAG